MMSSDFEPKDLCDFGYIKLEESCNMVEFLPFVKKAYSSNFFF